MAKAKGEFHVTGWDEKTYEELKGKAKLTQAHITQDYNGDLEGSGTWDLLMCYREDGTAVYTGFGKFEGKFGDRKGVVVMKSDGAFDGNEARSDWSVIVGFGAGDLQDLAGKGSSVAPHGSEGTYDLDLAKG
jgi:hypothetical protein